MTGYLLDDPRFMQGDKDRQEKVDKVFSDVEQLQKESMLSDRYRFSLTCMCIIEAQRSPFRHILNSVENVLTQHRNVS